METLSKAELQLALCWPQPLPSRGHTKEGLFLILRAASEARGGQSVLPSQFNPQSSPHGFSLPASYALNVRNIYLPRKESIVPRLCSYVIDSFTCVNIRMFLKVTKDLKLMRTMKKKCEGYRDV